VIRWLSDTVAERRGYNAASAPESKTLASLPLLASSLVKPSWA